MKWESLTDYLPTFITHYLSTVTTCGVNDNDIILNSLQY